MFYSKIPVLSKNRRNKIVCKQKPNSKMDMSGEVMYLQARIKVLEDDNAVLREERENMLQKLEAAVQSTNQLKSDILVLKESKNVANAKYQIGKSQLRKQRNKAFNAARGMENVTECLIAKNESVTRKKVAEAYENGAFEIECIKNDKNKEIQSWKEKYHKMEQIVGNFNKKANQIRPIGSSVMDIVERKRPPRLLKPRTCPLLNMPKLMSTTISPVMPSLQ